MSAHDPMIDGANLLRERRRYTETHLIIAFVAGAWTITGFVWLITGWLS